MKIKIGNKNILEVQGSLILQYNPLYLISE